MTTTEGGLSPKSIGALLLSGYSHFMPSDKKESFCVIINGDFFLTGTVFCRSNRKWQR